MKPKCGTKRLKLKCDILLSAYAFKFSLRPYMVAPSGLSNVVQMFETAQVQCAAYSLGAGPWTQNPEP